MVKHSRWYRIIWLLLLLVLFALLQLGSAAVSTAQESDRVAGVITLPPEAQRLPPELLDSPRSPRSLAPTAPPSHPKLDSSLAVYLPDAAAPGGRSLDEATEQAERLQVQVRTRDRDGALAALDAVAAEVTGVGDEGRLIQAFVSADALAALLESDSVDYVRRPPEPVLFDVESPAATSEGAAVLNANAWHAAGYSGGGVKIAIVDGGFRDYNSLLGNELPASVTVKNFVDGQGDALVGSGTPHGTACAEIVHDVAPAAELYLVKIATDLDLEEAVNYLIAEDVDVISTSLGWYALTPGDGTGFFANIVARARNAGILWATAAGNEREAHWGGTFNDPDGNGFHNFNGGDEVNYFGPTPGQSFEIVGGYPLRVFLRWDDWSAVNQDYDLILVRWNGSQWEQIDRSSNRQNGDPGQAPSEFAYAATSGGPAVYGFMIQRMSGGRNVNFEAHIPNFERPNVLVTARSIANLADAPDAVTVAALDVNEPYPQEYYSSEGPTNGPGGTLNGGFTKPDIAAFANVSTRSYGARVFNGTSSATPHVAGAAALVKGAFPAYAPGDVERFLTQRAIDMGPAGADTRFGFGRVWLGDAPVVVPPGAERIFLPLVSHTPGAAAPRPEPEPEAAALQISNDTGGRLRVELFNYGDFVFPEGVATWQGITPGSYQALLTSLGGPCWGSQLLLTYTFLPGETLRRSYGCGTNGQMTQET